MKLISWNVNGIRAAITKGFEEFLLDSGADIVCLQETKAQPDQVDTAFAEGYHTYWNSAEKKGYSGVLVFSKEEPLSVTSDLGGRISLDNEGRVLTLEYPDFYVVNVYTPNAQNGLKRIEYRLEWDRAFTAHLVELEKTKPVLACGDFNVSHHEIDLARPQQNRNNPGFSDPERNSFTRMLNSGFIDTFRHFHPDQEGAYSWWSYRAGARGNNVGWRLDYWLSSPALEGRLTGASILPDVMGSDHCPVVLDLA